MKFDLEEAKSEIQRLHSAGIGLTVDGWRSALKKGGITRLDLPEELGGFGLSLADFLEVYLELGAINVNLRDVPGLGHSRLFLESQFRETRHLAVEAADGVLLTSMAVTEEQSGSDLAKISSTVEERGDKYIISGEKKAVYRLKEATHFIVLARIDGELDLFICPSDGDKVQLKEKECIGLVDSTWGEVSIVRKSIPKSFRLTFGGVGTQVFRNHFSVWRTAMTVSAIGCANSVLGRTRDWMKSRKIFDKVLSEDHGLRREFVSHQGGLVESYLLARHTAELLKENDSRASYYAMLLKSTGIPKALSATTWALELQGWRGCEVDSYIAKAECDLKCLSVSSGASKALMDYLGRENFQNPSIFYF